MDKGTVVEVASFVELPQVIEQLGEGRFTVVVRGPRPDRSCLHLYLHDFHVADLQKIKSDQELDEITIGRCLSRVQKRLAQNPNALVHLDLSAIDWMDSIGVYAFANCESLVGITFPGSLKRVEDGIFMGCTALREVVLSEGIEEIGRSAFQRCHGLERVQLPSTLKELGSWAFEECWRLRHVELPEGLETMGDAVFRRCRRLERIRIPSTLRKVGDSFSLLPREEPDKNEQEKLDPASLAAWWKGVEEVLGDDCPALVEASIPAGLWPAFGNSYWCCREWHRLAGLRIPAGVGYIGAGMFQDCKNLEAVELPEGLLAIGGDAFGGCSSLKKINLPASLRFIGGSAFGGCRSLEPLELPAGLVALGHINLEELDRERLDQDLQVALSELEELKVSLYGGLDGPLFERWIDCTSLSLPAGLRLLGSGVLQDCDRFAGLDLPESLVYIGASTFEGCHSLKFLEIKDGLQFLGSGAFRCRRLQEVVIGEGITTLPNAFSSCGNLVSVTLPQSLTAIGEEAFRDCESLREVALPAHLETIGNEAFSHCNSLEEMVFPASLKKLGKESFGYCKGLQSVVLPAGLEEIGKAAFCFCESLEQVEFAGAAATGGIIGPQAFQFCDSLQRVVIPEGIQVIGQEAFSWCRRLSQVVLPKSLKQVGKTAFEKTSVKELVFPEGV